MALINPHITGLSACGTLEAPINHNPLGSYFGMFSVTFGIKWIIEYKENK